MSWYKENDYPSIAAQIPEYGIAYCQYSYSLPKPVTEFFQLFIMLIFGYYFTELCFITNYYNDKTKKFDADKITDRIKQVIDKWKTKYPNLKMKQENIKYESLANFNISYATEIELLNLDTNR